MINASCARLARAARLALPSPNHVYQAPLLMPRSQSHANFARGGSSPPSPDARHAATARQDIFALRVLPRLSRAPAAPTPTSRSLALLVISAASSSASSARLGRAAPLAPPLQNPVCLAPSQSLLKQRHAVCVPLASTKTSEAKQSASLAYPASTALKAQLRQYLARAALPPMQPARPAANHACQYHLDSGLLRAQRFPSYVPRRDSIAQELCSTCIPYHPALNPSSYPLVDRLQSKK